MDNTSTKALLCCRLSPTYTAVYQTPAQSVAEQVCPGSSQARWRTITSTDIVPDMLRPSTLRSRTSPRFQLHEGSPAGWFPENARRWNESTALCQIGCKETTSRTYSGLWRKCTVGKRTTWMHNTTGTCRHNGLPLWLVLCIEEWAGASEPYFRPVGAVWAWWWSSIPVVPENASKNNTGGLAQRKVQPKQVVHHSNTSNPERCFVQLFKNTANIDHQAKNQCILPHTTEETKGRYLAWNHPHWP